MSPTFEQIQEFKKVKDKLEALSPHEQSEILSRYCKIAMTRLWIMSQKDRGKVLFTLLYDTNLTQRVTKMIENFYELRKRETLRSMT